MHSWKLKFSFMIMGHYTINETLIAAIETLLDLQPQTVDLDSTHWCNGRRNVLTENTLRSYQMRRGQKTYEQNQEQEGRAEKLS